MADCEPSKPRTLQYDWKGKDLGPRNSLDAMDNNVQYEVFGVTKGTLTVKPAVVVSLVCWMLSPLGLVRYPVKSDRSRSSRITT